MGAWIELPVTDPQSYDDDSEGVNPVEFFKTFDAEQGTYYFGYDTGMQKHQSFREETRTADGVVKGRYGYVESGVLRVTEYIADRLGYRCRQTERHLVLPNRGVFVKEVDRGASPVNAARQWQSRSFEKSKHSNSHTNMRLNRTSLVQPAKVMGKKIPAHYKDFTHTPAIGGTALVRPWNSAHDAELTQDQVTRRDTPVPVGGTPIWPTTIDGARVVWRPYQGYYN